VLSRAAIRRQCAFTYMNAVSRKNLTDGRAQLRRTTCAPRSAQRRIRRCHRHRAVSPDDSAMHAGRERPLRAGRRAKKGAAKWGSLTPQWPLRSAATAAPTQDRRHRAPPAWCPNSQTGRNMDDPRFRHRSNDARDRSA
jgi:hypothetical protein